MKYWKIPWEDLIWASFCGLTCHCKKRTLSSINPSSNIFTYEKHRSKICVKHEAKSFCGLTCHGNYLGPHLFVLKKWKTRPDNSNICIIFTCQTRIWLDTNTQREINRIPFFKMYSCHVVLHTNYRICVSNNFCFGFILPSISSATATCHLWSTILFVSRHLYKWHRK